MKTFSSDIGIQKIKLPSSGRIEYADTKEKGLLLRVSPRGKTWYAVIRPPGAKYPRRIKVGPYNTDGDGENSFSLLQARRKAEDWKEEIRGGNDPREEGKSKQRRKQDTFSAIAERFLRQYVDQNLKSNTKAQYESILEGKDVKKVADLPVSKIKRQQIIELLDGIAESGRPYQANRTLAVLRKFFNWCQDKDILRPDEILPTHRVKPPLAREKPRSRYLSPEELLVVWRAAECLGWPFGDHIRLLIGTGQRQGECASIRRQEVSEGVWRQSDNKAEREHLVPLNGPALRILEGVPEIPETQHYYLSTTGSTPIAGFSKAKRRLDDEIRKICDEEDLQLFKEPWRTHDIRRTVTTLLRKMGTSQEVCSKLLNHAPKGVTAQHYDVYDMLPEKTKAMEAWGIYLERLIHRKAENVVEIRQTEAGQ